MLDDACRHKCQLHTSHSGEMVGTFQEILDCSSGNWVRIKSITDLSVLAFAGSCEAKYSSIDLNLGDFSFLLLFSSSFLFFPTALVSFFHKEGFSA